MHTFILIHAEAHCLRSRLERRRARARPRHGAPWPPRSRLRRRRRRVAIFRGRRSCQPRRARTGRAAWRARVRRSRHAVATSHPPPLPPCYRAACRAGQLPSGDPANASDYRQVRRWDALRHETDRAARGAARRRSPTRGLARPQRLRGRGRILQRSDERACRAAHAPAVRWTK